MRTLFLAVAAGAVLLTAPAFAGSDCGHRCTEQMQECMRGCEKAGPTCMQRCGDKNTRCMQPCASKLEAAKDNGKLCADSAGKPIKCKTTAAPSNVESWKAMEKKAK
jgi:hypothetical protein